MILLKLFLVLFFCVCYSIGGQGHKWVRRFLGPGVFGAGLLLIAALSHHFNLFAVLASVWAIPSLLIFKYGVNDGNVWKKVILRGVYGASLGLCGLFAGLSAHSLGLGVFQVFLGALSSILLGVLNPFSSLGDNGVMLEDVLIALGCIGLVPFIF